MATWIIRGKYPVYACGYFFRMPRSKFGIFDLILNNPAMAGLIYRWTLGSGARRNNVY
jgi:hypothetical protein